MKKKREKTFSIMENVNNDVKINIFMSLSLIQMIILARYKRKQPAEKILNYIQGEYVEEAKKNGETQVDLNFFKIANNYFKSKYHYEIDETHWRNYYNYTRNTVFVELKDCLLNELNNRIDKNHQDIIFKYIN